MKLSYWDGGEGEGHYSGRQLRFLLWAKGLFPSNYNFVVLDLHLDVLLLYNSLMLFLFLNIINLNKN